MEIFDFQILEQAHVALSDWNTKPEILCIISVYLKLQTNSHD